MTNKCYYYPKNQHIYVVIGEIRSKNSQTGEWEDHFLYTDSKGMYSREKTDFLKKFTLLDLKNQA